MKTGPFIFSFLFTTATIAQQAGVAISTDGSAPASSAMLDVKSTDKGMLVPRMTTAQRTAIANVVKGLLVFDNTTASFWFYNGTAWTELSSGGSSPWAASGTNVSNTNTGNVGIGTASPTAKLHVTGNVRSTGRIDADGVIESKGVSALGSLYVSGSSLLSGAVTGNNTASFGGNINSNTSLSINHAAAILQLRSSGEEKGFMQLSADDLRLGTNAGNTNGNVIVRLNGYNRFQFAPTGRLSIMADQFPTLYFNTGGVNRAYLQLLGSNIKLDAPANKVFIGDDLTVDGGSGRIGIGTTTPEQKLHLTGNAKVNGGKVLNNNNENMLPIAYGRFNTDGSKQAGTSNISAVAVTSGENKYYVISVAGVDLSNAVASVTCGFETVIGYSPAIQPHSDPTKLRLTMIADDVPFHMRFHIVIYKTN